jgi:hypothetical protein
VSERRRGRAVLAAGWVAASACPSDDPLERVSPGSADLEVVDFEADCREAHEGTGLFSAVEEPRGIPWKPESAAAPGDGHAGSFGAGLAVGDFDGDGAPDVYLPDGGGQSQWFRNIGDFHFEPVPGAGGADPGPLAIGASAADFDSDGDLDLVVMSELDDRIFRNEGDGSFTDITDESGIRVPERTLAVAWADVDGDRWLDPFFCTFFGAWEGSDHDPAPDHFYLGDGAGGWTEATERFPGAEQPSGCFAARFADFDGDGAIDLAAVNDKGGWADYAVDPLWMGKGDGTFSEEAAERGMDHAHSGMGLVVADLDGDSDLDAWKTCTPDRFLANDGTAHFVDASIAAGLEADAGRPGATWDVDAWDWDDDGDLDVLALVSDYSWAPDPARPDNAWTNDGAGHFVLQDAAALGLRSPSMTRSLGRADLDGDGAPDLVLPEAGIGTPVYQARCGEAGFVEVRVEGTHCARMAPGTKVRIQAGAVDVEQVVTVGGGVQSSQPPWLHFGLGDAAEVQRLSVRFPCGASAEFVNLPARTRLLIRELPPGSAASGDSADAGG